MAWGGRTPFTNTNFQVIEPSIVIGPGIWRKLVHLQLRGLTRGNRRENTQNSTIVV